MGTHTRTVHCWRLKALGWINKTVDLRNIYIYIYIYMCTAFALDEKSKCFIFITFAFIMFLMLLMNIVYIVCFDKFLMLLTCSI